MSTTDEPGAFRQQDGDRDSATTLYRLHGLVVSSPMTFSADTINAPGAGAAPAAPDVVFQSADDDGDGDDMSRPTGRTGEKVESDPTESPTPDGELVLEHGWGAAHPPVRMYRLGPKWLLRFPGFADFWIASDLRHVTYRWQTEQAAALGPILAEGFVLATVLLLRGHLVLHASAVAAGDSVIAVAGPGGTGKSTVAAILGRSGCWFIADDVLRVDLTSNGAVKTRATQPGTAPRQPAPAAPEPPRALAYRGSLAARLREPAWGLADGRDSVRTGDERLAVRFVGGPDEASMHETAASNGAMPLRHILIPIPDRGIGHVELGRLQGVDALRALLAAQRIQGWRDPTVQRSFFSALLELADTVPVWTARIPWGPPWPPDLGRDILEALGRDQAGSEPSTDATPT